MNSKFNETRAQQFLSGYSSIITRMTARSKELKDLSHYEHVRLNVKAIVGRKFGNVDVHLFGSRVMGLATDESDLDIYIDLGGKFFATFVKTSETGRNFLEIANLLEKSGSWEIKQRLLKTAVPIIICIYSSFQLSCDISMSNGMSTRNSQLIGHLFDIQPEAVSFYHFIRRWLKQQGCDLLKGYTMTLLVLFFLQQKNLMPKVQTVQAYLPKILIGGCEVQFNPDHKLGYYCASRMSSYKDYVAEFFSFYSRFNFDYVISTYDGCALNAHNYQIRYPKFCLRGFFVPGPCNRGNNCGVVDNSVKDSFIKICKASANFFQINDRFGRQW